MKVLRAFGLLAVTVLSFGFISSCNENLDPDGNTSNSEVVRGNGKIVNDVSIIDGNIEFMIQTPDGLSAVAYKSFIMTVKEYGEYENLNGKSFFAITSAGKYADEIFSLMGFSQNLSKSIPGDKLNLERVSGGNFLSNNSGIAFASYEGGDIYVKSISDTSITLRFIEVKTTNDLGDCYFNGDLTFDIE